MKRKKYRTLFISDLHLGSMKFQADAFIDFLQQYEFDTIYIVGDFLDIWRMKRRRYWPQRHTDVVRKLLKRSKRSKVIYVLGNHDEFLSTIFFDIRGLWGNIEICEQTEHITADGRKMLVFHGQQFDSIVKHAKIMATVGDWSYEVLITMNRWFNKIRSFFGLKHWSISAYVKKTVKDAVNFISNFEKSVAHYAKMHDADGVIAGHIHTPAVKEIDGVEYYNCGDWVESLSALIEDEHGVIHLMNLSGIDHPDARAHGGSKVVTFTVG